MLLVHSVYSRAPWQCPRHDTPTSHPTDPVCSACARTLSAIESQYLTKKVFFKTYFSAFFSFWILLAPLIANQHYKIRRIKINNQFSTCVTAASALSASDWSPLTAWWIEARSSRFPLTTPLKTSASADLSVAERWGSGWKWGKKLWTVIRTIDTPDM